MPARWRFPVFVVSDLATQARQRHEFFDDPRVRGDLAKSVTSLHANWAEPSASLGHGREHRRLHVLWRPGMPRLPRRGRMPPRPVLPAHHPHRHARSTPTAGQGHIKDRLLDRTGGARTPSASTSTGPTPLRGPHGLAGRGLVRRARQHHHRSQAPGPGPRRRLAPPRPAPGPAGLRGPRLDPQPRSGPRRGNGHAGEPHQRPRLGRTRLLVDLAGARGSPRRQGGATARDPRRQAGPPW